MNIKHTLPTIFPFHFFSGTYLQRHQTTLPGFPPIGNVPLRLRLLPSLSPLSESCHLSTSTLLTTTEATTYLYPYYLSIHLSYQSIYFTLIAFKLHPNPIIARYSLVLITPKVKAKKSWQRPPHARERGEKVRREKKEVKKIKTAPGQAQPSHAEFPIQMQPLPSP